MGDEEEDSCYLLYRACQTGVDDVLRSARDPFVVPPIALEDLAKFTVPTKLSSNGGGSITCR